MQLFREEKVIRELLIRVAKGQPVARRIGRISYKEIWEKVRPKIKWGQAHTGTVVRWITQVSALELKNDRPPLNELVTPTNKLVPKDPWPNGIQLHLKRLSGVYAPYKTHEEAQEACWCYWANHVDNDASNGEITLTETAAEEGYLEDKEVAFVKRNRKIIAAAKARDKFTCQACGFYLSVEGKTVIDCHHKTPLSHSTGARITKVSDLVCLCPSCHRIAHTKPYPLSIREIRDCCQGIQRRISAVRAASA